MKDLSSLTVLKLKELLRERNLPISGTKSELISRLKDIDNDSEDSNSVEVDCKECGTTLSLPPDYSGRARCPTCRLIFEFNQGEPSVQSAKTYVVQYNDDSKFKFSAYWKGVAFPFSSFGIFFFLSWISDSEDILFSGMWITGIASVVAIIAGFANGNRGFAMGCLTSAVLLPLIFVAGCFIYVIFFFEYG
ncbi:MAG: SAP domain-containing protein [Candidatus Poseidoniaceae archaeon]|jgi:hypothetical protein|nr:SAP domain-containing protein [Candidatus Poseidoniaceae archaeon]